MTLGHNTFSDWTEEEFQSLRNKKLSEMAKNSKTNNPDSYQAKNVDGSLYASAESMNLRIGTLDWS